MKAKGKFHVTKDTIKIILDPDFCRYYKWLFDRAHYFTIKTQTPKYGAHIGICNPNIHKNVDCSQYLHLNKQEIWFDYDIGGNYGGFSKGFLNFWLDIQSRTCEDIAHDLGILKKESGFAYFHITILNTKKL